MPMKWNCGESRKGTRGVHLTWAWVAFVTGVVVLQGCSPEAKDLLNTSVAVTRRAS